MVKPMQLGHVNIRAKDLARGICFLSADPASEDHELALARLRDDAQPTQWLQQVSFIVQGMDDLRDFYHRIREKGLRIDRTVTHGISCSIYFYDPEDNRIELYYKTGYRVRQPLGEPIDLDNSNEQILAFSKSFEATLGPPRGASK